MDKTTDLEKKNHMTYHLTQLQGENATIIKPVMIMEEGKILDDYVRRFNITKKLFGEVYRCNIIDTFVLSTKKLPYACISVTYEQSVLRSYLYKLYIQFRITDDIKSADQLINNKIRGKFTIEIVGDKQAQVLEELDMENESTFNKILEKMEKLTKMDYMIKMAMDELNLRYKELKNNENYDEIYEKLHDLN